MTPASESTITGDGAGTRAKANRKDRQARKYGFACANCRRRKARCNGGIPSCDRCLQNNEACYFDKVPSVTYSLALQDRLKASENLLDRLRDASQEDRLRLLEDHFTHDVPPKIKRATSLEEHQEGSPRSEASAEDEVTELLNETSVGEDGRICFYGRTSLYHLQPEQTALASQNRTNGSAVLLSNEPNPWKATLQKQDSLGLSAPSPSLSTSAQTDVGSIITSDISPDLFNELLDVYWCWPHHFHLVLCRTIFMRDLTTSGPYVTLFLLNAVLAQAARFSDRVEAPKISDHFAKRALGALADDLDKGSSIPTIQGLLIFSARECASGRTSQGWLYSGMAFRMMRDLGIQYPPSKLSHLVGQFSQEDLALRQQIFWACYTWDKTMSLCLGRAPTIHDVLPVPAPEIWPDGVEAENEDWKPKFSTLPASEVGFSQKSWSNSRFTAYCQLCVIIDDVLDSLYSRPHGSQQNLQGYLERTIIKLEEWARALPTHLFVRESSRVVSCPPLHILLHNLLYHATIILLCRPYRSTTAKARKLATQAAEMIDFLLTLHVRRFGFRVMTYLESYTVFVGSTINILDMKDGKGQEAEAAGARLAFCLEILRNSKSTPSNVRCVEIIEQLLKKDERAKEDSETGPTAPDFDPTTVPQPVIYPANSGQPRHSLQQSGSDLQFCPTTADSVRAGDLSFLNMSNHVGGSSAFDQTSQYLSGANVETEFAPQAHGFPAVETPLRWLPDNLRNDFGWVITEKLDFAGGFGDQALPMNDALSNQR